MEQLDDMVRAGLATLDLYRDEGLFERSKALEPVWADAIFSKLKGQAGVLDIRQLGLTAAIDIESWKDAPGKRAYVAMDKAFHDEGIMIRTSGDCLVVTPPFIITESDIAQIADKLSNVIASTAMPS